MTSRRLFRVREQQQPAVTVEQVIQESPKPQIQKIILKPIHHEIEDILTQMLKKLSSEQIIKLVNLKYPDKTYVFTTDSISALTELIGYLITSDDYDKSYDAIKSIAEKGNIIDNMWDLPNILDHEKQYRLNIKLEFAKRGGTIFRDRICPKCRGNEFIALEAQLASADESTTEFYTCVRCN
jgi:DNA-directed RNA polymerase subunit M/transcription elongation factor TFIIS